MIALLHANAKPLFNLSKAGLGFIPLGKSANRNLMFEQSARLAVRTLAQLLLASFGLQQAMDGRGTALHKK